MSAIDWLRILDGFRYCFRTARMLVLTRAPQLLRRGVSTSFLKFLS